ncbi:MAG TPA: hypothetical protein VFT52_05465 [Luteimonas sp.]|jgi:hypothetical protein|nr:hypothetical protein [Luteimonas sp.]
MPMSARARNRKPAPAVAALALLLCAACSKPEPPDTDRPPEPQADAAEASGQGGIAANEGADEGANATELRDAIRQPIDRAKAVDGQVEDAAAKQRAAVDAQSGY